MESIAQDQTQLLIFSEHKTSGADKNSKAKEK